LKAEGFVSLRLLSFEKVSERSTLSRQVSSFSDTLSRHLQQLRSAAGVFYVIRRLFVFRLRAESLLSS
jgi:hypothetical protein